MNHVDIVFPVAQWDKLNDHLFGGEAEVTGLETLAYLLTSPNVSNYRARMLVVDVVKPNPEDYESRTRTEIRPTSSALAAVLSECRTRGLGLVEVHTHPFDSSPHTSFSGIDWANDRAKMPQMATFMSDDFSHATMVMGQNAFDAHYFNSETHEIHQVSRIRVIGRGAGPRVLRVLTPSAFANEDTDKLPESVDRHRRFLGERGTRALIAARVAIVGIGGIGSVVATELAHLGVKELILVDPDYVEPTNLNRLVGSSPSDVGRLKVDSAKDAIMRINPAASVVTINSTISTPDAINGVKSADVILGCVDSHGGRLVLNQLALQYAIPFLDAGSGIVERPTGVDFGGQVQLVTPGSGCLVCRGFIDARQAAFDLASPETQRYEILRGYGTQEIAPSVVSLNGVVGSLQVQALIQLVAMDGLADDLVIYDGRRTKVYAARARGSESCASCGPEGVVGFGDRLSLNQDPTEVPVGLAIPPAWLQMSPKPIPRDKHFSGLPRPVRPRTPVAPPIARPRPARGQVGRTPNRRLPPAGGRTNIPVAPNAARARMNAICIVSVILIIVVGWFTWGSWPLGGSDPEFVPDSAEFPYTSQIKDSCEQTSFTSTAGKVLTIGTRKSTSSGGPFGTSPTRCSILDIYAGSRHVGSSQLPPIGSLLAFPPTETRPPIVVVLTSEPAPSGNWSDETTKAIAINADSVQQLWQGRSRLFDNTSFYRMGQSLVLSREGASGGRAVDVIDPSTGKARFTAGCPSGTVEGPGSGPQGDNYVVVDDTGVITTFELYCAPPAEKSVRYIISESRMSRS